MRIRQIIKKKNQKKKIRKKKKRKMKEKNLGKNLILTKMKKRKQFYQMNQMMKKNK